MCRMWLNLPGLKTISILPNPLTGKAALVDTIPRVEEIPIFISGYHRRGDPVADAAPLDSAVRFAESVWVGRKEYFRAIEYFPPRNSFSRRRDTVGVLLVCPEQREMAIVTMRKYYNAESLWSDEIWKYGFVDLTNNKNPLNGAMGEWYPMSFIDLSQWGDSIPIDDGGYLRATEIRLTDSLFNTRWSTRYKAERLAKVFVKDLSLDAIDADYNMLLTDTICDTLPDSIVQRLMRIPRPTNLWQTQPDKP